MKALRLFFVVSLPVFVFTAVIWRVGSAHGDYESLPDGNYQVPILADMSMPHSFSADVSIFDALNRFSGEELELDIRHGGPGGLKVDISRGYGTIGSSLTAIEIFPTGKEDPNNPQNAINLENPSWEDLPNGASTAPLVVSLSNTQFLNIELNGGYVYDYLGEQFWITFLRREGSVRKPVALLSFTIPEDVDWGGLEGVAFLSAFAAASATETPTPCPNEEAE